MDGGSRRLKVGLAHRPVRSAKLTIDGDSIELTEATAADQRRLVEAFLARHAAPPGA